MNTQAIQAIPTKRNRLLLAQDEDVELLVKAYVGKDALSRQKRECQQIEYWGSKGYKVPKLHTTRLFAEKNPYLVMEYLQGQTLKDFLRDVTVSNEKKLATIEQLFLHNKSRYCQSLSDKDEKLVHYDSNTGNIILQKEGFSHIDFEMPFSNYPVLDAISNELAKLIRWIAKDMGKQHLNAIIEIAARVYMDTPEILHNICRLTLDAPVQWLHRIRDKQQKKRHPDNVTKYDIADALARVLEEKNTIQMAIPFRLRLSSSDAEMDITCERVIRHLPNKRLVCEAKWLDKTVLLKLYYDKQKGQKAYRQEEASIDTLNKMGLPTQHILFSGQVTASFDDTLFSCVLKERVVYAHVHEYLQDAQTLKHTWESAQTNEECRTLFQSVLMVLAQHHEHGVFQTDLHLGNFLMANQVLYTIDGDTIRILAQSFKEKESLEQLGLLLAQVKPKYDELTVATLPVYFAERGMAFGPQQQARIIQHRDKKREAAFVNRMKKSVRECSEYGAEERHFKQVHYAHGIDKSFLQGIHYGLDAFLEEGQCEPIKRGRTATVYTYKSDLVKYVIKRYNIKSGLHALERVFKVNRARTCWLASNMLTFYGIPTPKPIASVEYTFGPIKQKSYFVSEYIQGQNIFDFLCSPEVLEVDKQQAIASLKQTFALFERYCISHGDLKRLNLIVHDNEVYLIDLDVMKRHRWRFMHRRALNQDKARFLANFDKHPELKKRLAEALNKY